jgi:hypothetical protein
VEYINAFEEIVKHHLTLEQIYNINEMGLLGHSFPNKTLSGGRVKCKIK